MQNILGFTSITKPHHVKKFDRVSKHVIFKLNVPKPAILKMFQKPAIEYAQAVPRGVSYKTLIHLTQLGQSAKLTQFDYGPKVNLEVYGSRLPPEYNMSAVTAPVALLFSDGDAHVSSEVCMRTPISECQLSTIKY